MAKLKDQILKSALTLFREKGYDGVSLRAIAEHAGTTIGNLTYHYPQKGDLLVAMQLSAQSDALTHFGNLPATPEEILAEVVAMCYLTEEVASRSSFYFCNILQLCSDVPALKKNVEKTREIVRRLYIERLLALREKGYMRADMPDGVYESLAVNYLMGVTGWYNVRRIFEDKAAQIPLHRVMLDLMRPLLTEEGLRAYHRINEHLEERLRETREKMNTLL